MFEDVFPPLDGPLAKEQRNRGDGRQPEQARRDRGRLGKDRLTLHADIPLTDGKAMAWLYARGEVTDRLDGEEFAAVSVRLDPEDVARFTDKFGYEFRASPKPRKAKKPAAPKVKKTAQKKKTVTKKQTQKKKGSAA